MIHQKRFENIAHDDLNALVAASYVEDHNIDYKEELPDLDGKKPDDARKKLLPVINEHTKHVAMEPKRDRGARGRNRRVLHFSVGMRVRVRRDPTHGPGPWPDEPMGTIVADITGAGATEVVTSSGLRRMYWVHFDQLQIDADGDGPYSDAQVLEIYLEHLTP